MDKLLRDHLLVIYKHLLTSKSSWTVIPKYRNYDFRGGGIVVLERKYSVTQSTEYTCES